MFEMEWRSNPRSVPTLASGGRWSRSRSLRENSIDPVYATRVIRDNPSRFLRLETLESQTTLPFLPGGCRVAREFRPLLPVATHITNSGSHLVQLSLTERACGPRPPCRFSRSLAPPQPERRQSPNPADQLATANPRPDVVEVVPAPIHDVLPPKVVNGLLLRRQGQLVFVQQGHLHQEEPFLRLQPRQRLAARRLSPPQHSPFSDQRPRLSVHIRVVRGRLDGHHCRVVARRKPRPGRTLRRLNLGSRTLCNERVASSSCPCARFPCA